jgi:enterochelin esterase-like enzyme
MTLKDFGMRLLLPFLLCWMLTSCTLPTAGQPTPTPSSSASPLVGVTETDHPYDPRVEKVSLDSPILGIEKSFFIYVPPDVETSATEGYPVLYLFRGHEKEWVNPDEDPSRQGQTVIDVYEELRESGAVGPMILVFPGMSSDDNSVPGMLVNMESPDNALSGIGTGRFEDYFIQELLPYVDSHYPTSADASQRGVDGFSMGGFMATKIATQHPDMFGSVGAFDGLYFYTTPDCQLDDPRDNTFDMSLFTPAFGSPRDIEHATANNAPSIICTADPAAIQSLEWFIQFGPESAEPNDANFYRGVHLLEQLGAKGVENGFDNPILEGGHRWVVADEHMRQTLPLHWQALSD